MEMGSIPCLSTSIRSEFGWRRLAKFRKRRKRLGAPPGSTLSERTGLCMMTPVIIDVHVHPVSRDLVRDPRNLRMMERDAACLADDDAVSLLIERMDRAGVDRACLMGPTAGDGIALTNEMVRAAVARHPERLVGFVGVDPIGSDPGRVRADVVRA